MFKKLLKFAGFSALAMVLLLAAVAVALKIYLTPERVRVYVEKDVASRLHREVKLGGISISLFSGLTLTNVAVSETPTFSSGTIVSAEKIQVAPQLLPLLSKKFFADRLVLIKPRVTIVRHADGTYNYTAPTSSGADPGRPSPTPSSLVLMISKIAIESGDFSFIDQSTATQSTQIKNLNLTMQNASLISPVTLQTDFDLKRKDVEGRFIAKGKVGGLIGGNQAIDLAIKIEKMETPYLPKVLVRGEVNAKGTTAAIDTTFDLAAAALRLKGRGDIKEVSGEWTYNFHLNADHFNLEDLAAAVPALQGYGLAGPASTIVEVKSAPNGPDVKGTARLTGASLLYEGMALRNIISTFTYTLEDVKGVLTADGIEHERLTGGRVDLTWDLKNVADMAKIAGPINLHIGEGKFRNVPKKGSGNKIVKVLLAPVILLQKIGKYTYAFKLPDLENISYREIIGAYILNSGVLTVHQFDLVGKDLHAGMTGTVGLTGAQPLKLEAQLKLAMSGLIGGTLGLILNDSKGHTTLQFKIRGTVDKPEINAEIGESGKNVLEAVKEKYGEKPVEQVEKLLKGLFKK